MTHPNSDVAFTPAVKASRPRRGSRRAYARMEDARRLAATASTPELAAFIAERDSFFLATANAKASRTSSIAAARRGSCACSTTGRSRFADYRGNRQYITLGNLAENDRAFLFLIDYATSGGSRSGVARASSRRSGAYRAADARGLRARSPSRPSCSTSRRGTPTARSTSRACTRRRKSERSSVARQSREALK